MTTTEQILAGFGRMANQWTWLAIVWHGVVAVAIGALTVGWRPTKRLAALLATLPLVSVSLLAFIEANPTVGTIFAVAAVTLGALGWRMPHGPVCRGVRWVQMLGVAVLAYAWVYPHFLVGASWATYLYAAPLGLLPSPTLAMVVGFGLLAGGFGDRGWSGAAGALGLIWALFGTAVFGVALDLGLLVGAAALSSTVFVPSERPTDWSETEAATAPSAGD